MSRKIIDQQIGGRAGTAKSISQARHYDHRALARESGGVNYGILLQEPEHYIDGMVAVTDGVTWNISDEGPGMYQYTGGRWHKIGPPPFDNTIDYGDRFGFMDDSTMGTVDYGNFSGGHPSDSDDFGAYS